MKYNKINKIVNAVLVFTASAIITYAVPSTENNSKSGSAQLAVCAVSSSPGGLLTQNHIEPLVQDDDKFIPLITIFAACESYALAVPRIAGAGHFICTRGSFH